MSEDRPAMEKFRCPTCLTLLAGAEQRCPACHSRLRKRRPPIVLGEASQISSRVLLPFEREVRARAEASNAAGHPWHVPHISLAAKAGAPEPAVPDPPPEALVALLAFEADIPAPAPVDIDLTIEPDAEPERELVLERASWSRPLERVPPPGDEIHEIFAALHRKARAVVDEPEPAGPDTRSAPSGATRAERLSTRSRRRRWNLPRRGQPDPDDS